MQISTTIHMNKIGRLNFFIKFISPAILLSVLVYRYKPEFLFLFTLIYSLTILPFGIYKRAKDIFTKEPTYYVRLHYDFTAIYAFSLLNVALCGSLFHQQLLKLGLFSLTLTPYLFRKSQTNLSSNTYSNAKGKVKKNLLKNILLIVVKIPVWMILGLIISAISLEGFSALANFISYIFN